VGGAEEEIEFTLLNKRQCKVYPVPPATASTGHRAEDWKESIWVGRCRVVGRGTTLTIRLLDSTTDELFAQCIIPNGDHEKCVERVLDSSRYFVLKVTNKQRHAFIGFGFSERNDAFDFMCCLSDFKARFVEAKDKAEPELVGPSRDLALKEGQTITLNLKGITTGARRKADERQQMASEAHNHASVPLLPPPPAVERGGCGAPPGAAAGGALRSPPGAFRPVPPRGERPTAEAPAARGAGGACAPGGAAPEFADFEGATATQGPAQSAMSAEESAGHKRWTEHFFSMLPVSALRACTFDPRNPDSEL